MSTILRIKDNTDMRRVLIVPIGVIDPDILHSISKIIEEVFPLRAEVGKGMPVPHHCYNSNRRQYHATPMLKEMQGLKQKGFERVLGVTDVDLYEPDLNFIFGEAAVYQGVAVISLARLREEFYGRHPDKRLLLQRAGKEAVHELGHTYGLDHCPNPKCIMYFSNRLRDTDVKGPGFCRLCKDNLGI
jgi:archaemetzincin